MVRPQQPGLEGVSSERDERGGLSRSVEIPSTQILREGVWFPQGKKYRAPPSNKPQGGNDDLPQCYHKKEKIRIFRVEGVKAGMKTPQGPKEQRDILGGFEDRLGKKRERLKRAAISK